jgi:23S rRNA pseudouridine1911/1915/1917 synthase
MNLNIKEDNFDVFNVPENLSGLRADVAVSHLRSDLTRSQIRRLISEKSILVEGKAIKPSKRVIGGEVISVIIPPPEPLNVQPQDIEISIIYEDDEIILVNKPPGLAVHPGAGIRDGTLVNALLYRCNGLSGIGGKIRPGIVHRLDKNTSGIIVVAKNDFSHQHLVNQFKARLVKKMYIALVVGEIEKDSGTFSSPISRHPTNRIKMTTKTKKGREALTSWRILKRYDQVTLVAIEPKTGRTHQIRVHFADNGFPLLGDDVYGPKRYRTQFLEYVSKKLGRQALHASKLCFKHPKSGNRMEFSAPLAEDLMDVIGLFQEKT